MSIFFDEEKICELIAKNPGIYLSKIASLLNMKISTVEECILELENNNVIISIEKEGYKRYYFNEQDQRLYEGKISEIRKKIYALVEENPGVNLTVIAEMLEIRISLAEYHLLALEKNNSVVSVKEFGHKRFYVKSNELQLGEMKLLALLRQELPLKIVLLLLKHSHFQHKELLEYFDIAPSTLSYHLNKLLRDGVLSVDTYGQEKGYAIKNTKAVIAFLTKYKLYKMTKNFTDMWDDLKYQR